MSNLEKRSSFNRAVWQIKNALDVDESAEQRVNRAFGMALKAIHAESGAVWLYDKLESGRITPRFVHGSSDITALSFAFGEGFIGEVVQRETPMNFTDLAESERHLKQLGNEAHCKRGLMAIPLKSDHDAIGCIHVVAYLDSVFDEDNYELLDMFSLLAAMEIEKSGLLIPVKRLERVIQLRDITKSYGMGDVRVHALRGVNLDIYRGEFLVILGKSGCGKTTLLNIIGGMDGFDGGVYQFGEKRMENANEKELTLFRRENVGFIFQQYSLMQDLTARENLMLIAGIAKSPADADQILRLVGLADRADNYPSQLSGGEQQRVAIARALVKSPQLVLADEPTAALDEATGTEVLSVFERLVRKTGITLVMITHNPEISLMADRIAKMREGRISEIIVNTNPLKASELAW